MNDLISRSEAMENYCNALCPKLRKGEYCNDCIVKAWLNNQPTAFDVDLVVDQLGKRSMLSRPMGIVTLKDAIEIMTYSDIEYQSFLLH